MESITKRVEDIEELMWDVEREIRWVKRGFFFYLDLNARNPHFLSIYV